MSQASGCVQGGADKKDYGQHDGEAVSGGKQDGLQDGSEQPEARTGQGQHAHVLVCSPPEQSGGVGEETIDQHRIERLRYRGVDLSR